MSALLPSLLPLIIGSVLAPTQVTIVILLLQSPQRGLLKGIAYAGGGLLVRLLQALLFVFVLSGGNFPLQTQDWHSAVSYTLLFVLGIALLIASYEQWQRRKEPANEKPKWLAKVDSMSVFAAFSIGFVQMLVALNLWVFTLSAMAIIATAGLGADTALSAVLLFIFLVELPVLIPILIRLLMPKHSVKLLQGFSTWITDHDHLIIFLVSFVLGLYLLARGIQGLITYG